VAPFDLLGNLGTFWTYTIYLFIGIGFGAVLELAGFANSPKLAAQFYFTEIRVVRVMFTAIVVCMVLLLWASGLGWLDLDRLFVNPAYLGSGIVGGLLLGFGFIIGGYCPGTAVVASATGRLDGIVFGLGVFAGIFVFGELYPRIEGFMTAGNLGAVTLPEVFNLPYGLMVLMVVVIALLGFVGAEAVERWTARRSVEGRA